ncbi:protein O-mannosyl-transferase [Gammaproteobacteria bacterium]
MPLSSPHSPIQVRQVCHFFGGKACLVLLIAVTIAIYLPGLSGLFMFDDEQNITNQQAMQMDSLSPAHLWRAALSSDAGPLKRPVSMLSFALNAYLTGLDPYPFKAVNLAIHIVNGVLIYVISLLLFQIYRRCYAPQLPPNYIVQIALAITAVWLLHPINLSTVLYVVQRMTGLSTLFSLMGIALYLLGRQRQMKGERGTIPILAAFLFAWPMAVFSKENGVLLPTLLAVLEVTVLRLYALEGLARRRIIVLFTLTVILPFLAVVVYLGTHPNWLVEGYANRPFTLGERLLTEARVLWLYLGLLALPSVARLGLYHDDISLSQSLLDPMTTLWAVIGVIMLVSGAIVARRRFPLISFGLLFFLIAQGLESSIIPLEIVHEHRNYLPSYGILVIGMHYILRPTSQPRIHRLQKLVVLTIIAGFALVTGLRANLWGNPTEYLLSDVKYHPNSPRTNYEAGRFLLLLCLKETRPAVHVSLCGQAKTFFLRAHALDPLFLAGPIAALRIEDLLGRIPSSEEVIPLRDALATEKILRFTPLALATLGQCTLQGDCHLPVALLDELYAAILSNPTLDRENAGALHNERAIFAHHAGDIRRGSVHPHRSAQFNIQIGIVYLLLLIYD